jgi:peptide/nickel transport system permease protein
MTSYVLKRLGISALMLVLVSLLIFIVLRALPGDPTTVALAQGDGVDEEALARMAADLGLDRPVLEQYWTWITHFIVGDFGYSYFSDYPVGALISQRLPATLALTIASLVLAVIIALVAATLPLRTGSTTLGRIVEGTTVLGLAAPPFVIGIVLIVVFTSLLGWLPSSGFVPFERDPGQWALHLLLPSLTLAFSVAPQLVRYLQGSIGDVRWATFVRTARGKGIGWGRTVDRHILPNALLPALTSLGISVGMLLGGSVVVEAVFAWPGLGQLTIDAVMKRDYAVIQTVVMFAAAAFVLVTLLVDVLYGVLDPRLRVTRTARPRKIRQEATAS